MLPNRGSKYYEAEESDYHSQISGLKAAPSNVVCQQNSSTSSAAEMPTTNEQNDEGVSGRLLIFMIEFANIL